MACLRVCPRKRNGNTPVEADLREAIVLATMCASCRSMLGTRATQVRPPILGAERRQMLGGFSTCMATSGNGQMTGMGPMQAIELSIRQVPRSEPTRCSAVDPGIARRRIAAHLIAAGGPQRIVAPCMGLGSVSTFWPSPLTLLEPMLASIKVRANKYDETIQRRKLRSLRRHKGDPKNQLLPLFDDSFTYVVMQTGHIRLSISIAVNFTVESSK